METDASARRGAWRFRRGRPAAFCAAVALAYGAAIALSSIALKPAFLWPLEGPIAPWIGDGKLLERPRLRIDPIFARAAVLEPVHLSLEPLRFRVPALFVRPNLHSLLRGRIEPSFATRGFDVAVDAHDGPSAFIALLRFLEDVVWPGTHFSLRGGEVRTETGLLLLERLEVDLTGSSERPTITLRAQQGGSGQIDAVGRVAPSPGETRVDVYVDKLGTDDLRRWLALATGGAKRDFAEAALPTLGTGHWYTSFRGRETTLHQLDLQLDAAPPEKSPSEWETAASRFSARALGSFSSQRVRSETPGRRDQGLAGRPARSTEGWLRVEARLGRLKTFAIAKESGERLLVSGRVGATFWLQQPSQKPQLLAFLSLDDAHLGIGKWFRKPARTPASLRIARDVESGLSNTRIQLDVAGLRAQAQLGPSRAFRAQTEWLPVSALQPFFPRLDEWAQRGAIRLAFQGAEGEQSEEWMLELDEVELLARHLPTQVRALSGQARIEHRRKFEASELRAEIAGIPMTIDLRAELSRDGPPLRLRFHARAERMDLAGLKGHSQEGGSTLEPASPGSALPASLRAAVEEAVGVLHRERGRLGNIELESGTIEVKRVQCGNETLHDLRIELRLQNRRLGVRRFSFQNGAGIHRYRGFVDLNPLPPEVEFAAGSSVPAALSAP